MLKSLPVAKPQELWRIGDKIRCCNCGGYTQGDDGDISLFSWEAYKNFREHTPEFVELAALHAGNVPLGVRRAGSQAQVDTFNVQEVSGNFFKPPFGGPEHVLHYLARYTHRVAISNHRLLSVSADEVCFRWKDYAHHGRQRTLTLASEEFLRRFVQHVLPRGFPRIRYFGFLANRRRTRMLPPCRALLRQVSPAEPPSLAKTSRWMCPHCHGLMLLVEWIRVAQVFFHEKKERHRLDSS